MFEIDHRPGITLAELGRVEELSKGPTSILVERLRTEGYVEKPSDSGDRRITRHLPTGRMDQVWQSYDDHDRAAVSDIRSTVSEEDRRLPVRVLHKMREVAGARGWSAI